MSRGSNSAFTWDSFRQRIKDLDPDLRHMALFDLCTELQKDSFTLDDSYSRMVVGDVLKSSKETHSDVQTAASRCFGPLVKKVKEGYAEQMLQDLAEVVKANNDQRDVASMSLKTIVECIPATYTNALVKFYPVMLQGLAPAAPEPVKCDTLDIFCEVLKRFGKQSSSFHGDIQKCVIVEVQDTKSRASVRKKAITCLSQLSVHTSDELFEQAVQFIHTGLSTETHGESLRKYIQLCSSLSRTAGSRLGKHVDKIYPHLQGNLDKLIASQEETTESDEVRENILQAFDNFVQRCPSAVTNCLPGIIQRCTKLLTWDPLLVDVDEEEEGEGEEYEEEEDCYMDDGDGDFSWKVRKAAAKCLTQVLKYRPDTLEAMFKALCCQENPVVPSRFKERVETVRLEVFSLFMQLLDGVKVSGSTNTKSGSFGSFAAAAAHVGGSFYSTVRTRDEARHLQPIEDDIIKSTLKSMKHKSIQIKTQCFEILCEIFAIAGGQLMKHVPTFIAEIKKTLTDPALGVPQLKIEVLQFARLLAGVVSKLGAQDAAPAFVPLFPVIYKQVDDKYYKTVTGALKVCAEFVGIVCMLPEEEHTLGLYRCVYGPLVATNVGQEVKNGAIATMALVIKFRYDVLERCLKDELPQCYAVLLDLIKRDMSRLAVTRALHLIRSAKFETDVVNDYVVELGTLIRKIDRQVRESALRTLASYVPEKKSQIKPEHLKKILEELCSTSTPLLSIADLFICTLSLQLCRQIALTSGLTPAIMDLVVPAVLQLLQSPLLQGNALKESAGLFTAISDSRDVPYGTLVEKTVNALKPNEDGGITNVAIIIGIVVSNDPDKARRAASIKKFADMLKGDEKSKVAALHVLGEIGSRADITALVGDIRGHLAAESEEVKTSAAAALGKAASSNFGKALLEELIASVKVESPQQYFLLRALREAIVAVGDNAQDLTAPLRTEAKRTTVVQLLLDLSPSTDEGIRDVVSECLGRYARIAPSALIPSLAQRIGDSAVSDDARATIVSSMKYVVVENASPELDSNVSQHLGTFLRYLNKANTQRIRRAAVQLLIALGHSKPSLLSGCDGVRDTIIPALLEETITDMSLVREVDLGPFKHLVDDGLDLRKSAFECLDIFVDSVNKNSSVLDLYGDFTKVLHHVGVGLADKNQDINAVSRGMLVKLSGTTSCASAVLHCLEPIVDALKPTIQTGPKPKDEEAERLKVREIQRSSIVALLHLEQVVGVSDNSKFRDLREVTERNDAALFEEAQALVTAN